MSTLGLDIGGANLKAYHAAGVARCVAFAVWKQSDGLAAALRALIDEMPGFDLVAVTMTAELCDCFRTKRAGVAAVLDAVQQAVAGRNCRVYVWQTTGEFVSGETAKRCPLQTAAANWMALSCCAGRFARDGAALLIDIGSTTTDIVPLLDGVPVPQGRSDPERLASGELVYTGLRRTPVCAVVPQVPWRGQLCPVAAEWFATTQDVYLMLGLIAEDPDCTETADGRPATRPFAHERLARVIAADAEMLGEAEAVAIAQHVADAQLAQIAAAAQGVVHRLGGVPQTIVLSGDGEVIADRLMHCLWGGTAGLSSDAPSRGSGGYSSYESITLTSPAPRSTAGQASSGTPTLTGRSVLPGSATPRVIRLSDVVGDNVSRAACAYAVATLLAGEQGLDKREPSIVRPAVDSRRAKWEPAEVVVKVGGSLFEWPDLAARLREYLASLPPRTLLVSGGGRMADCVRQWDAVHALGEERAHWLAIRSMSLGSHFLAAILPAGRVVTSLDECPALWTAGQLPILDPGPLLQRASCGPKALPSSWNVTSDSIAAWVARQAAATQLVLLKSAEMPKRLTVDEAIERELVDPYFAAACEGLEPIVCVNLRRQPIVITTMARSDAGIS